MIIRVFFLCLILVSSTSAQDKKSYPNQTKPNEKSQSPEDAFLEVLRERFEKDVGDLEKLLLERGNVDQFMRQRLELLMEQVGEGIRPLDEDYLVIEEKDSFVIELVPEIDSGQALIIDVSGKGTHVKGQLKGPARRKIDINIDNPPGVDIKNARVDLQGNKVKIIFPKLGH